MNRPVVAVDVGNSAIKLCVAYPDPDGRLSAVVDQSIPIDRSDWEVSVLDWVRDAVDKVQQRQSARSATIDPLTLVQWRVAAVQRQVAKRLHEAIGEQSSATVRQISWRDVPISLRVDHPDLLGIDRVLGAYAARNRCGQPLIVVDAGSAVTVDWVNDQGEFCGGAILPGLMLQLAALATGTDALPRIGGIMDQPLRVPGTNTSDAIRLGVMTAIAATIDRLAGQYGQKPGEDRRPAELVLTGGDAVLISPLLESPHQTAKNLVCRGLLDLPRSTFAETNQDHGLE